jgi:hypothetical protein
LIQFSSGYCCFRITFGLFEKSSLSKELLQKYKFSLKLRLCPILRILRAFLAIWELTPPESVNQAHTAQKKPQFEADYLPGLVVSDAAPIFAPLNKHTGCSAVKYFPMLNSHDPECSPPVAFRFFTVVNKAK